MSTDKGRIQIPFSTRRNGVTPNILRHPLDGRSRPSTWTTKRTASSCLRRLRSSRRRGYWSVRSVLQATLAFWVGLQVSQRLLYPIILTRQAVTTTPSDMLSTPPVVVEGTKNHNKHHQQHPPRVLVGIFSTDSLIESQRRQMVRASYLSYYHNNSNDNNDDPRSNTATTRNHPNHYRICSLQQFQKAIVVEETTTTINTLTRDCQFVYTFVVGGAEPGSGRMDLVEPFVQGKLSTSDLALPTTTTANTTRLRHVVPNEPLDDVVLLNVEENMNHGKSQSWFLYATQTWSQIIPSTPVDYIVKMDSDTMLYPDVFLDDLLANLPTYPHNSEYAGSRDSTTQLSGPYYLTGSCYLLSWDLAQHVVSKDCPRTHLTVGAEDKSMGNFVWTFSSNIRLIQRPRQKAWMQHPVKDPIKYRRVWNQRYPYHPIPSILLQ